MLGAELWKVKKRLVSPNSLCALIEHLIWKEMKVALSAFSFFLIGTLSQDLVAVNDVCIPDDKLRKHVP